jgi:hypothetical protein
LDPPIAPASDDCTAALFGIIDGIKLEIKLRLHDVHSKWKSISQLKYY